MLYKYYGVVCGVDYDNQKVVRDFILETVEPLDYNLFRVEPLDFNLLRYRGLNEVLAVKYRRDTIGENRTYRGKMTHYQNWDAIPKELRKQANDLFDDIVIETMED